MITLGGYTGNTYSVSVVVNEIVILVDLFLPCYRPKTRFALLL